MFKLNKILMNLLFKKKRIIEYKVDKVNTNKKFIEKIK